MTDPREPSDGPQQKPPPTEGLEQPSDDDSELICFCMHVREATLLRAVERGARTVDTLSDWTAAGMGCGTCRFDLEALLERAAAARGEDA